MARLTLKNLRCKVSGLPEDKFRKLRRYFSYPMDFHMKRSLNYQTDGRIHMITKKGSFYFGLVSDVRKMLKEMGEDVIIDDLRERVETPTAKEIKDSLKMMPFKPRPYQLEQILRCCVKRHGIVHSATGSGKTFTMAATITAWDRPTVILVNSKDLLHQLRAEIAEYRGDYVDEIGILGDSIYKPKRITVAMVQTVTYKRLGKRKKKIISDMMDACEVLMVDEVHNAQSKTFKQAIRMAGGAVVRIGYSATPITSPVVDSSGREVSKDIVLKAYFGPILHRVRTKDLIDMGYLASCTVKMIENQVYFDGVTLDWADEYSRIIVEDEERNDKIASIIADHYSKDEKILTFVTRLDHGRQIADLLVDKYDIPEDTIAYVTGESHAEDRAGAILDFKEGGVSILLGTVLSEGLNFFCDAGINASCGKSTKLAIQRIGRILRKERDPELGDVNPEKEEHVIMYDFADLGHPFFQDHAEKRESIYKREGHPVERVKESEVGI